MLIFIKGAAKSGKTTYIHKRLCELAQNNSPSFFIVPEQATFQNEKKLFKLLPKDSYKTSVISFSRFSEHINSLFGGSCNKTIDKVSQLLLMGMATNQISDNLNIYKKYRRSPSFMKELISLHSEFINSGIKPCDISSFSFSVPDGVLKEKSYELSLILDCYESLCSGNFLSEKELAELTVKNIYENKEYMSQKEIFIDDFISFTYPQSMILKALISTSKNVTIALSLVDDNSEAFETAAKTLITLSTFANENNIEVKNIDIKTSFLTPSLKSLEQSSRNLRLSPNAKKTNAIHLNIAANPYEELCSIAAKIKFLVREKHAFYSDIVLMAENYQRYIPYMESVFNKYEIPYFADNPQNAVTSPLCNGILTAAKIAAGFRDYDLCDLAFSPIIGIDKNDAGEFQNYCYIWSLSPSQQFKPFKNNPKGLKENFSESEHKHLNIIEKTRKKLAEPILKLKGQFKKQTPKDYAVGIFDFLTECNAIVNLKALAENMSQVESENFLLKQNLLWEQFCNILDMFYSLSDQMELSPIDFTDLLETAISTMEVATIPKAIDLLDIGTAHRMRADNPDYVFIAGICQGEFPTISTESSLLTNRDRCEMIKSGLAIGDFSSADSLEKAICYRALTTARKEIFLSYPKANQNGEIITPSIVFSLCEKLATPQKMESPLHFIETKASLTEQLAKNIHINSTDAATIRALGKIELNPKIINKLENAVKKSHHKIFNKEIANKLFGNTMRLSPSQIENYHSCHYRYFLRYGLKLYPIQKAELNNLEAGTLLHFILEKMIGKYGKNIAELSQERLKKEILNITEIYLKKRVENFGQLEERIKSNFYKISDWIYELLLIMAKELAETEFTPKYFELPIKKSEGISPIEIKTANGSQIFIEGIVDRVDTLELNNETYVRIIDYKSGSKIFSLSDVLYGLNMQMLIYLFSIWENGKKLFDNPSPAGILYQPAIGKYHQIDRNKPEKLAQMKMKSYKMNGLLLNNNDVLHAMEPDGNGIFIPFGGKKSTTASLATLEEMGRLNHFTQKKIQEMARNLNLGQIEAIPIEKNFKLACEYCDYRSICDFNTDNETNKLKNIKVEDFWKEVLTND